MINLVKCKTAFVLLVPTLVLIFWAPNWLHTGAEVSWLIGGNPELGARVNYGELLGLGIFTHFRTERVCCHGESDGRPIGFVGLIISRDFSSGCLVRRWFGFFMIFPLDRPGGGISKIGPERAGDVGD